MIWNIANFHWAIVILAACFTLRGHGTHIDLLWRLFLVGRICPLMREHFLWPLIWSVAFLLRLNKGFNFLQSAFWIWITERFLLVRECNKNVVVFFLQCCITLGPAHEFSLQDVKLSRIVIYRYKIIRIKCSFNWSCINYGEMHCDSVDSSLVFFYKCVSCDWSAYSLPW